MAIIELEVWDVAAENRQRIEELEARIEQQDQVISDTLETATMLLRALGVTRPVRLLRVVR